jgi:ribulose bisphosphate carboxylase small subunit
MTEADAAYVRILRIDPAADRRKIIVAQEISHRPNITSL